MRQVTASVSVLIILALLSLGLEGVGLPRLLPAAGERPSGALANLVITADPSPATDEAQPADAGSAEPAEAGAIGPLALEEGTEQGKRCSHPGGFTIAYPPSWSVDSGRDELRCTRFDPDELGPYIEGRRQATVVIEVIDRDFDDLVLADPGFGEALADTAIDGRRAVRLSGEDDDGVPFTRYLIDLTTTGSDPRTLVLDTVGVDGIDHDTGRRALDLMARSINVAAGQNQIAPTTVTRFGDPDDEQSFTVLAESDGGVVCLRLEQQVEGSCIGNSGAPATVSLDDDGRTVIAGVVPGDTFRVDLVDADGSVRSVLPAPVLAAPAIAAFAAPEIGSTTSIVLYDLNGRELSSHAPQAAGG